MEVAAETRTKRKELAPAAAPRYCLLAALYCIALGAQPRADFVGAAVCAQCHQKANSEWSGARHGRMLQPATVSSVEGDFRQTRLTLRGRDYRLRIDNGVYYISEPTSSGEQQEHRVDYTLGSRRIQHYLTRLSDGRIVVLPPSWDVTRRQWFHNMDIVNPEEYDGGAVQVWNKNCFPCHVSGGAKNFKASGNSYDTSWQDFGTSCERCHGPGAKHVDHYRQTPRVPTPDTIVLPTRLDAARSTMICAQCHSLRDTVSEGFTAGSNYYDFYLPVLEYGEKVLNNDPSYWADGRPRRFSDDAVGFWQSECFLKGGATCINCHSDVHDPDVDKKAALHSGSNQICEQCHSQIGQNLPAHTHHAARSAGSSCVECHMPRTVYSIKAEIRDHSISVPVPENTEQAGIPNACNLCHRDKSARWAAAKVKEWYPENIRQKWIRRASAFSAARAGDPRSIGLLLAIVAEPAEGPIAHANAVGHLSRFSADPRVLPAMLKALTGPEPLVRAVAALRLPRKGDRAQVVQVQRSLVSAMGDPIRIVRVAAVLSLVDIGVPRLTIEDARLFARAKAEYLARARIVSDDAEEQFNAASFELLSGESASGIAMLRNTLSIDPGFEPAKKLLRSVSALVK